MGHGSTRLEETDRDQLDREAPKMDPRSARLDQNSVTSSIDTSNAENCVDDLVDQNSSGGTDTIVPDVLDCQDDETVVEIESPRGGKYTLRPNPTPNFTDEHRY